MKKSSCWFEKFGLVVVVASLFACGIAKAASGVSLQWNPNADPSVVGYKLYYGGASRSYTNVINLGNVTNAAVSGLTEGKTYFFAVTAYDEAGDESYYSDETIYVVPGFLVMTPGASPGAPVRIQFPVAPNHWYELQASTDLRSWTTIWQVAGIANNWVEYDASPINGGQQFFRLILH
jgi:predicted RNA-binding protein with TRAM domain